MKNLLFIAIFISLSSFAQYDLNWKISDTLRYKTIMKDVALPKENNKTTNDSTKNEFAKMKGSFFQF